MRSLGRLRWALLAVVALLALYALLGYVVVPRVLKSQLEAKLPEILHRKVAVEAITFDPFALALDVRGLAITEQDGGAFVSFDELFVDAAFLRLIRGRIALEEVRLVAPAVKVALLKDGRLSFADLFEKKADAPKEPEAPPGKTPEVEIDRLELADGKVSFADYTRSQPFEANLQPIKITVTDFSTAPQANSPYAFSARFDRGASLSWAGDFSVNPLHSKGKLAIEGIALASLAPYLRDVFRFEIASGALGFTGSYLLEAGATGTNVSLSDARFRLTELGLTAPGSKDTKVGLGALTVAGIGLDLGARTVRVSTVALDRGVIRAVREKDGSIDLATLGAPPEGAAKTKTSTKAAEASAPWKVSVGGVHLGAFDVRFEDRTTPRPATFALEDLDVKTGALALPGEADIDLALTTRVNGQGKVDVKGKTRLGGRTALSLKIADLALPAIQPYLEASLAVDLVRGALGVDAEVELTPAPEGSQVSLAGDVTVTDLSVLLGDRELAGWKRLALEGLKVRTAPTDVMIETVRLAGLRASYTIGPDGKPNTDGITRPPPRNAPRPKPGAKAEPPAKIAIAQIVLEDGTLAYTDRTLKPAVELRLQKLKGRVAPYFSTGIKKTSIDLDVRLDAAPLTVKGTVLPAGKASDVDLAIKLTGFDLLPLSPYFGKYAGYAIDKGKLSLDLGWNVHTKKLEAKNVVVVDQLTLGDSVESPDATSMPVKLGLAILTDRHGRMELDVPVSGDLDDPELSVGKVVVRALLNVLEKAVTAPFALLGALVGGSDEELSQIAFPPGSAAASAEELAKVDKLARALLERPALKLSITGTVDPALDRPALAKEALMRAFRAAEAKKLAKSWEEWLRAEWKKKHPTPAPGAAGTTASAVGAPNGPAPGAATELGLADMEAELAAAQTIGDDALETLRGARAKAVQDKLLAVEGLGPDRLFVAAPKPGAPAPKPGALLAVE